MSRRTRRKLYKLLDGIITFVTAAGVFLSPFALLILCKLIMK